MLRKSHKAVGLKVKWYRGLIFSLVSWDVCANSPFLREFRIQNKVIRIITKLIPEILARIFKVETVESA